MDEHIIKLQSRCRLSNCFIKESEHRCSKHDFVEEFMRVFNVDLSNDDPCIHPPFLCNKHRSMLTRARNVHQLNEIYVPKDRLTPFEFTGHVQDCTVCRQPEIKNARRGRPAKRLKPAGPGIYARESYATPELDESEVEVDQVSNIEAAKNSFEKFDDMETKQFLDFIVNHLSPENLIHLSSLLGKAVETSVKAEAGSLKGKYKKLQFLIGYDPSKCVDRANNVLLGFLKAVSGLDEISDKRQLYHLSRVIEGIYKLCMGTLVTPLAFLTNLHCYVESGSRAIVDLIGTSSGGGCYDTISNWLNDLADDPIQVPDGDLGHAFDNNQKIGKSWRVSVNNTKFRTSVITTHIWIKLAKETFLQNKASLKPIQPFEDRATIEKIRNEEDPIFTELDEIHYQSLYYLIDSSIKLVENEQELDDCGEFSDHIDKAMEDRLCIKCTNCLENGIAVSYSKLKKKCDVCHSILNKKDDGSQEIKTDRRMKGSIVRVEITEKGRCKTVTEDMVRERYGQIPSHHPPEVLDINVGEPTFVDPNSYKACTEVLCKIGKEASIEKYGSGNRQWIIICCDGLPFRLCHNIIKGTFVCTKCNESFFGKDIFTQHYQQQHEDEIIEYTLEFDWVLLKPAGGHIEINSIKAFFELNWETFLSKLCLVMGYKSEAAQYVAKACKDHHQAWELLLIFFFGSLRELITIYVREQKKKTPCPSLSDEGFIEFTKTKTNNPNFLFLFSQVTVYAFAIINFRMAMRRDNYKVAQSAMYKIGGLFHGRNHPFYQLIELYFISQHLTLHDEVRPLYEKFFTISLSGDHSKGEDWDFVLENINKKTQGWLPNSIPTNSLWQKVCRNNDPLEELKILHYEMMNMKKSSSSYRKRESNNEINEWQIVIRESDLLNKNYLCGITENELVPDLLNFTRSVRIRRYYTIGSMLLNEDIPDERFIHPIYITPEEREKYNDISNMRKDKIRGKITKLINDIPCHDTKEYFLSNYEEVKDRKAELVKLYHDVFKSVQNFDDCMLFDDENENEEE